MPFVKRSAPWVKPCSPAFFIEHQQTSLDHAPYLFCVKGDLVCVKRDLVCVKWSAPWVKPCSPKFFIASSPPQLNPVRVLPLHGISSSAIVLPANPCINTPLLQDTPAHRTLLLLLVLLLAGVSTPASPRPSSCSSFKPLCILVINTGDPYQWV